MQDVSCLKLSLNLRRLKFAVCLKAKGFGRSRFGHVEECLPDMYVPSHGQIINGTAGCSDGNMVKKILVSSQC